MRRAVHGVLLLDKPLGLSSNEALQKAKCLLRAEKAGHTGTLDPLATGLLPLCFGAATKFSQFSLDADKTLRAALRLGAATTTGDAEGEVSQSAPCRSIARRSKRVRARSPARSSRLPPMHSALKNEGRPLYDYARAGIEVERDGAPCDTFIASTIVELAGPSDAGASTCTAARAPTSARWPRTSARRWAAART